MMKNGTRFSVWAVFGEPSSLIMKSELPWSAVRKMVYPLLSPAVTTCSTHLSTVSTALMAASLVFLAKTILLLEDDDFLRDGLCEMLKSQSYDPFSVSDIASARKKALE